jgi:hypothetical protein
VARILGSFPSARAAAIANLDLDGIQLEVTDAVGPHELLGELRAAPRCERRPVAADLREDWP